MAMEEQHNITSVCTECCHNSLVNTDRSKAPDEVYAWLIRHCSVDISTIDVNI